MRTSLWSRPSWLASWRLRRLEKNDAEDGRKWGEWGNTFPKFKRRDSKNGRFRFQGHFKEVRFSTNWKNVSLNELGVILGINSLNFRGEILKESEKWDYQKIPLPISPSKLWEVFFPFFFGKFLFLGILLELLDIKISLKRKLRCWWINTT